MGMVVATVLRSSARHGLGVFLAGPVGKGGVVWAPDPCFSHLIAEADFLAMPLERRLYVVHYGCWHPDRRLWEMPVDDTRFINHDERPTLLYDAAADTCVAARDLPAGTELTSDYRDICGFFRAVPSFDRAETTAALGRWRALFGD